MVVGLRFDHSGRKVDAMHLFFIILTEKLTVLDSLPMVN
jgi:hypothetical protein